MSSVSRHRHRLVPASLCGFALAALAWSGASRHTSTADAHPAPVEPRASAHAGNVPVSQAASAVGAASLHWAGADPFHVEPRVPRAAGAPCVVEIVRDRSFQTEGSEVVPFLYMPLATCPGPWSKVTLAVELSGPREPQFITSHFEIAIDVEADGQPEWSGQPGVPIFFGSPQAHAQLPVWRLERDLTDYASLFTRTQTGVLLHVRDNARAGEEFEPTPIRVRSAKLLFYRPTAETPAQRVADEVRPAPHWSDPFPRNIERVYVDVLARGVYGNRFWFACVPDALAEEHPMLRSPFAMGNARGGNIPRLGCTGGAYREVEVHVDGQRAGLAPMCPWLPSNFHLDKATVDDPAPSVQALEMVPYRVDLSPFAALLSDGMPHRIELALVGDTREDAAYEHRLGGALLLYLDHGSTRVTGALTRNTLTAQAPAPTVSDDLTWNAASETLEGTVSTRLERRYVIEGHVDTSRGRVNHRVWQRSLFNHANHLHIVGPDPTGQEYYFHDYAQGVRLSNTLDRISQSTLGGTLIRDDREYRSYPLVLDYRNAGEFRTEEGLGYPIPALIELAVHQARGVRASYVRPRMARYRTWLADVFDASYAWQDSPRSEATASSREYLFADAYGGCYSAALATADRMLVAHARGTECPNGRNALRWFSHPDGSPESLGWAPRP